MTVDEKKKTPQATIFSLAGTPRLSEGRYDVVLTKAEDLIARVKVYAEGGENVTHQHPKEDHLFFILGGQATFRLGINGEEILIANKYEGVMVPKGAYYAFASSGNENLVMFRVGQSRIQEDTTRRLKPDGTQAKGHNAENNWVAPVAVPGEYFFSG